MLSLSLIHVSAPMQAADGRFDDIVMLKNHAVIKGEIRHTRSQKFVTIETLEGQVHKIPRWRIAVICDTASYKQDREEWDSAPHPKLFNRTDYNFFNINLVSIMQGENQSFASLASLNGLLIDETFSICLALELISSQELTELSIYSDFRYYISVNKTMPFVYTDAGYTFSEQDDISAPETNGLLFGIGIGTRQYLGRNSTFIAQIGYRVKRITYSDDNTEYLHMIQLGIGLGLY